MKAFVKVATKLGLFSEVALRFLTIFPSRWTAYIELSRLAARNDTPLAGQYAESAIRDHRGVIPPYEQLVKVWVNEPGMHLPSLFATVAVMPNKIRELAEESWANKWPAVNHLSEPAALSEGEQVLAAQMIGRIGGKFRGKGVRTLARLYGASWIDHVDLAQWNLDESLVVNIFDGLRQAGEVRRPIEFLSSFPPTQAIEKALMGANQDLRALEGSLDLEWGQATSYGPNPLTSLYLLHNSLPEKSGGYSTRSHGLISGLRSLGVNAVPVTRPGFPSRKYVFDQDPDTPEMHVVDGITYHRLKGEVGAQPRSDLQGFLNLYVDKLEPLIRGHRPSVFHSASNWWNGFAGVAAARRFNVHSVYEIRGLWELTRASRVGTWSDSERYRADANYETMAASLADRVIVITEGLRDEMVSRGIPRNKMTVVPNAVDLNGFKRQPRDERLASQLELSERCVVGFAGSLTFYEGLDDLLRAGAEIRGKTSQPFSFLFVGDGAFMDELVNLAEELGVTDLCRFTGRVPHADVPRYLSIMDITPFPRIPIPVCELVSPLKPLESMASGVSILASDVRALEEMVPPGTGITFSKGDVASLADRLSLMIGDPDLRRQLAENAMDWVAENRNWHIVSSRIRDLYEELAS